MTDQAFIFDSYGFEPQTGTLSLRYAYQEGPSFVETIVFPAPAAPLTAAQDVALDRAFRLIFLLAGISYYKAHVPPRLICRQRKGLDAPTAAFLQKVYLNGLGEFAYRNQLDLSGRIAFETAATAAPDAVSLPAGARALVPVGGGKDSIVTIEALKAAQQPMDLFVMCAQGPVPTPIAETIAASGEKALIVRRTLSPNLAALNAAGAYNGHVPITAILSAVAVATAILQGHGAVVLSNEHSADAPNLRLGDLDINHQYSKSLAFEDDFAAYVRAHVTPDVLYFSFLRPLTEAEIARRFTKLPRYFDVFRSCNKAFRQDATQRLSHWCCDCPKCRFVFLALAPFLDKERLSAIFGHNMLDDAAQQEGFEELCGLGPHKPFECVGEIRECALLMNRLMRMESWASDTVVSALKPRLWISDDAFTPAFDALYALRAPHRLPAPYLKALEGIAS